MVMMDVGVGMVAVGVDVVRTAMVELLVLNVVLVGKVAVVGGAAMVAGVETTREAKLWATFVAWAAWPNSASPDGSGLFTAAADEAPENTSDPGRGGEVLAVVASPGEDTLVEEGLRTDNVGEGSGGGSGADLAWRAGVGWTAAFFGLVSARRYSWAARAAVPCRWV